MDGEYDKGSEKSKYNRAHAILQQLDLVSYQAMEAYRKGDLEKWYHELRASKHILIGKMGAELEGELRKLEIKINYLMVRQELNSKYKNLLILYIEEYLKKIQIYIEESGMGLIGKEDETIFA